MPAAGGQTVRMTIAEPTGRRLAVLAAAIAAVSLWGATPIATKLAVAGLDPLAHIPEAERWTPRRVYYATARKRDLASCATGGSSAGGTPAASPPSSCRAIARARLRLMSPTSASTAFAPT